MYKGGRAFHSVELLLIACMRFVTYSPLSTVAVWRQADISTYFKNVDYIGLQGTQCRAEEGAEVDKRQLDNHFSLWWG